jgi:hypothetical protein
MTAGPKDGWLEKMGRAPMKACAIPFTYLWPLHNVSMRICRRAFSPAKVLLDGRLDMVAGGPNQSRTKHATALSQQLLLDAATLHVDGAATACQAHWLHVLAFWLDDRFFF